MQTLGVIGAVAGLACLALVSLVIVMRTVLFDSFFSAPSVTCKQDQRVRCDQLQSDSSSASPST